jgi:hypothetical protein
MSQALALALNEPSESRRLAPRGRAQDEQLECGELSLMLSARKPIEIDVPESNEATERENRKGIPSRSIIFAAVLREPDSSDRARLTPEV